MRVRLEDVARAAGVSPKTVSRVLNDEANVTDATREWYECAWKAYQGSRACVPARPPWG